MPREVPLRLIETGPNRRSRPSHDRGGSRHNTCSCQNPPCRGHCLGLWTSRQEYSITIISTMLSSVKPYGTLETRWGSLQGEKQPARRPVHQAKLTEICGALKSAPQGGLIQRPVTSSCGLPRRRTQMPRGASNRSLYWTLMPLVRCPWPSHSAILTIDQLPEKIGAVEPETG